MIRSLVPQQVASLRSICVKICDRADGVNVWAAWVLLIHMLSDPRLRKLVQASPITDHEVSAAYLFTNYARAEVTRRARMDQAANQKRAKTGKAVLREDAEAGPSHSNGEFRQGLKHGVAFARTPGTDMEGVAEFYAQAAEDGDVDPELARGVKVACEQLGKLRGSSAKEQAALQVKQETQTLSLKRKRPPCSGVVQVSGGVLDYWAAALELRVRLHPQDHDHAIAQPGQPGFGRDAHGPGAARVQQRAQRPAAGHLHAQRGQERRGPLGAGRHRARARAQDRDVAVPQRRGPADDAHGPRALVVRRLQHHRARRRACRPRACRSRLGTPRCSGRSPSATRRRTTRPPASCRASPRASRTCTPSTSGKLPLRNNRTTPRAWSSASSSSTKRAACDGALDVTLTGVARSFVVHARQARGWRVADSARARHRREHARRARGGTRGRARRARSSDFETVRSPPRAALGVAAEPYATPSNNLALALEANEQSACSSSPRATAATRAGTSAAWPRPPSWPRPRARSTTARRRCCPSSTARSTCSTTRPRR